MLKEGVLVLFLRRPLTFVVKGEDKMDAGAPQVDSAEITSPKKEGDSGRIGRNPRLRLRGGGNQSRRSRGICFLCRVHSASREEQFTSATNAAVRKRSDTGSLRRWWWLKKVEKLEQ